MLPDWSDGLSSVLAGISLPSWLPAWTEALLIPMGALLAYALVSRVVPFFVPAARREVIRAFLRRTRPAVQLILVTLALQQTLLPLVEDEALRAVLARAIPLIVTVGFISLTYRTVGLLFTGLRERFDTSGEDNLKARQATTQIIILERVIGFIIIVVGIAVGLLTIPGVRQYGASLLASAGVAGLVVGFAAQQTIANVLAGIQIAITQPLRIDDAVVIDGEWGWVEEITLTYIVVRVWDKRRLVVPISYLLQKPFQNWTRSNATVIGTVYLHVDYTLDLAGLRAEQTRVLASRAEWDGDVDVVQVVDTTEHTMVVRSLVSAPSSPRAWDLRCALREALLVWIRTNHPDSLPRERMRIRGSIQS